MIRKLILWGLFVLYGLSPHFGRRFIQIIVERIDGGEFWSISLRKIYIKYHAITVGIGSYGCFDPKRFPSGTEIGNYCSFASDIWIFNANHPLRNITTHPRFYNPRLGYVREERITRQKLSIGHDVWIGHGTIILPNVTSIGTGAVIGAGSVITKNVEPFGIVVGNPAKEIQKRFSSDVCEQILESKWFLESPMKLSVLSDFVDNPDAFTRHMRKVE